jgi:hypothetical protein
MQHYIKWNGINQFNSPGTSLFWLLLANASPSSPLFELVRQTGASRQFGKCDNRLRSKAKSEDEMNDGWERLIKLFLFF